MAENNGGSKPEDLYHAPDPTGIFELVDLLGEGSYGSVYKVCHSREVAFDDAVCLYVGSPHPHG